MTVKREEKYEAFRMLHERPGAFVIPNPWNAGTAKILAALGFEALATTSAGYAFSIGRPDSTAELTREGILENARAMVEATHLPVSADLQDGFGRSPERCAETDSAGRPISVWPADRSRMRPGMRTILSTSFRLAVERVAAAAEAAHQQSVPANGQG